MEDTTIENGAGVWLDAPRMLLVEGLCLEQEVRRATKHILCAAELLRYVTVLEMMNSNGSTHVTRSPALLVNSRRGKLRKFDPQWVNYYSLRYRKRVLSYIFS